MDYYGLLQYMQPHTIRGTPTQLQQIAIPTVSPQYTTLYDTKYGDNSPLPYEELKQHSKATTTYFCSM